MKRWKGAAGEKITWKLSYFFLLVVWRFRYDLKNFDYCNFDLWQDELISFFFFKFSTYDVLVLLVLLEK